MLPLPALLLVCYIFLPNFPFNLVSVNLEQIHFFVQCIVKLLLKYEHDIAKKEYLGYILTYEGLVNLAEVQLVSIAPITINHNATYIDAHPADTIS